MLNGDLSNLTYKYNQGCFYSEASTTTVDTCKLTLSGGSEVLNLYYTIDKGGWVNDSDPSVFIHLSPMETHYNVSVRGEELAELRVRNREEVYLTVKNNQFYCNPSWAESLDLFCCVGGFTYENIRELHIAYDTYDLIKDINYYYFKLGYPLSYSKPIFGETSNSPVGFVDSARIGSLKSDLSFSIYNKQGKLESTKKYIKSYWEKNGLAYAEGKEINRLEMRLKDKAVKKREIVLRRLNEQSYLLGLLKYYGEKRLRFVVPSGDLNSSRSKKVNIIDWDALPVLEQLHPGDGSEGKEILNERAAKMLLKKLHFLFLMTNTEEVKVVIKILCTVVSGLEEVYRLKKNKWLMEYNRITGAAKGLK